MAVFIGATKKSDSEMRVSLQRLNEIGNKIISISVRPEGALFTIPVAKAMMSFDNKQWVVVPVSSMRKNVMRSAQEIYVYGKEGVDYKVFKTAKAAQSYIEKIKY